MPRLSAMSSADSRARMQQLLQTYGSLLTDKQAAFARAFFVEGKTFSQIARESNISRQAVHEAVHNVEKTLRFYEEKLSDKLISMEPSNSNGSTRRADAAARLETLKAKISHRGIIYNVDWIIADIDAVIDLIE